MHNFISESALLDGNLKPLSVITKNELNSLSVTQKEDASFYLELNNFIINSPYTNESLAEEIGVSAKTISRWRNDETMPEQNYIIAMCFVLKLGYERSIYLLALAGISLVPNKLYNELLMYYPFSDLYEINSFLENNGEKKLT